jgi:plastocyanin domain-containing protein
MKANILAILVAGGIIGAALLYGSGSFSPEVASTDNVSMENGTQVITVTARDKYSPHLTAAKAGVPTVLRMETNGTLDCSLSLTIPSIGYRQMLPTTGTTDIPLPAQQAGATVRGICAMGMKNFAVKFN